jgi:hypothetical protein
MRVTVCICLLVFAALRLMGQSSPVFRHFTSEDGLPGSQVYQVLSDSAGVIWLATDHGLVSYNGYEFRTWSTREDLIDNTVFKLQFDKAGVLWMQTFSGQLFYLKDQKILPYRFNHVIQQQAGRSIPQGFFVDDQQNVYFSSTGLKELKIDAQGRVSVMCVFGNIGKDGYIALHEIKEGVFVSSSNNAMPVFSNLYLLYTSPQGDRDTLVVPHGESCRLSAVRRRNGDLLISVGFYIYKFEKGQLVECGQLSSLSNHMFESRDNTVWLATFNGLVQLKESNAYFSGEVFLPEAFISWMGEDFEGALWATSINHGVYSLTNNQVKYFSVEKLPQQEPLSLCKGKEGILVNFWNGYLMQVSNDRLSFFWKFPGSDFVSSLLYDSTGDRLFVAKAKPGYLQKGAFYPLHSSHDFALKGRLLAIGNGDYINATATGLYWFNQEGFLRKRILPFRANDLCYGKDSIVVFAGSDGVYRLDQQNDSLHRMYPELQNKRVQTLAWSEGVMVTAIRGEGLWIEYNGKWFVLNEERGLTSNFINRLIIDKGKCWCSSFDGISRFDLSGVKNGLFNVVNYNNINCLPENEVNDILIADDTIWVASKNAISFFPVNLDPRIKLMPQLMISGVTVNNKIVSMLRPLELEPNENNISVSFLGVSPSSSGAILYRYLLISDRDTFESFTTNRQVDFPALGDGRYTFQVFAKNVHGVWTNSPVSFSFKVKSPLWKRWWMIGLGLIVVSSAVYLLLRFRVQKVRREQEWKSGLERQLLVLESKALRSQMNPHFIFNVMNSIQDFILKNDMKSAQKYLTKFARLVRMILDNSVQSEVLLDEELKANRLYIELEQQRFNRKFDFDFEIEEGLEDSGIRIPSMLIQPFLENAVKHGISHLEGQGYLRLSVKKNEADLLIEIQDNGVGRKAAAEWNAMHQKDHHSMGSMLTEKRVEILNATLHAGIRLEVEDLMSQDGRPAGTLVRMVFPTLVGD